jgi:hypothetical protein
LKRIKIIIGLIIGIIIILAFIFYNAMPDYKAKYDVKEIKSQSVISPIFIKRKVWGITYDNQIIVISSSAEKEFNPDSTMDYIYQGLSPFYYKFYKDSLFIYTMKKSDVPQNLKTGIKIVQVELENPEMMRLIKNDQYKAEGLNTFE